MLKKMLEKEALRQGYTVLGWKDTLKYGWGMEVEKNDFYTTLFVDDLTAEIISKEMQEVSSR